MYTVCNFNSVTGKLILLKFSFDVNAKRKIYPLQCIVDLQEYNNVSNCIPCSGHKETCKVVDAPSDRSPAPAGGMVPRDGGRLRVQGCTK
jgi:hypothetical protein